MNGLLIWITGLSGAGKTVIGKKVYEEIKKTHLNTVFLDGDDFRTIMNSDLTHNNNDRLENAWRIVRMCEFLTNQNINVICSTMSLYKEIHKHNYNRFERYFDIFIDVELDELISRNQKELYSKALNDGLKNVVGINLSYDKPENCSMIINNNTQNQLDKKVQLIMSKIHQTFQL